MIDTTVVVDDMLRLQGAMEITEYSGSSCELRKEMKNKGGRQEGKSFETESLTKDPRSATWHLVYISPSWDFFNGTSSYID